MAEQMPQPTHEVLGIFSGEVKVQLGGSKGIKVEGKAGT